LKFNELSIEKPLLDSVEKMGFEEATPIQAETIPVALKGKDVIGQAQTGTGKTAAFGLPMLNKINSKEKRVQGLVIAPTRELAIQVQEELYELSKFKKVKVMSVYGGASIGHQIKQIKQGAQIVVGTPGRMLDHINRGTLKLNTVETLVLDEADEMLNMGFIEDIEKIISEVPSERQTLLFSATMPKPIQRIGERFMKNPELVKVKAKSISATSVTQYFTKARDNEKFDIMTRLLDVQNPTASLVFARTKKRVDELAQGFEIRGFKAEGIHGDLAQNKRMKILKDFKAGKIEILVATDVAARGIDVEGLTHVYNYDIPQDPESYVHRIGRTGRAGQKGVSVTFVTPQEMGYLKTIENLTKQEMSPLRPPTNDEAVESQLQTAMGEVESLVNSVDSDRFKTASSELLKSYSAEELAEALLKSIVKEPTKEVPVRISPQKPLPSRNNRSKKKRGGKKPHGNRKNKGNNRRNHRNNKGRNRRRNNKN